MGTGLDGSHSPRFGSRFAQGPGTGSAAPSIYIHKQQGEYNGRGQGDHRVHPYSK